MNAEQKYEQIGNIVLVGFMGAGKTTVGRLLAQKTNKVFLDTDELIEKKNGMDISNIFLQKGEAYFRNEERLMIKDLLLTENNAVIATGGGLPCHHDLMDFINKHSISVYLMLGIHKIWERIALDQSRPLLQSLSNNGKSNIRELLKRRRPIYQEAEIKVRAFNEPNRIVDCILRRIK